MAKCEQSHTEYGWCGLQGGHEGPHVGEHGREWSDGPKAEPAEAEAEPLTTEEASFLYDVTQQITVGGEAIDVAASIRSKLRGRAKAWEAQRARVEKNAQKG